MSQGAPSRPPVVAVIDDVPTLGAPEGNTQVEIVEPGAPLVITFGFYEDPAVRPGAFEFLGRLKKLELISGRAINKLLVRDPSMRWYLAGIEGVGDDVESTAAALREFVDRHQPSSVITVGQSMGAYGAILYGTLIGADKVVAFGPLSCFDRRLWSIMNEVRWLPPLFALDESGVDADAYRDLPRFLAAHDGPLPDIDVLYGNSAGEGVHPHFAVAVDPVHAVRFVDTPGVTLLPIEHSLHGVVEHFRSQAVITEVLRQRIFGTSLAETINGLHGGEYWMGWLIENFLEHGTLDGIRPYLLENVSADEADALIARAKLIIDLSTLEDQPPRFTA